MKGVIFVAENPAAPPSAQHDAWTADELADGWVYGPVKDAEKKTHPCIVHYDALPADQKAKHYVFKAIVNTLLSDRSERRLGADALAKASTRAKGRRTLRHGLTNPGVS